IFECLTGNPPFIASTVAAVVQKITAEKAPSLKDASLGKEFPPLMESIVEKLLSKNVADRYQSALELSVDLAKLRRG
ncbi:hypothetical protein ABTK06_20195, partial [Acinetobacter baumannii]